jgi:uncharacterized protein YchJ
MARITNAKAGRNDLCPCGSGKKFKRCCELQQQRSRAATLMLAVVAALVLGGIAFAVSSLGEGSSSPAPGRVWSQEHGHWH